VNRVASHTIRVYASQSSPRLEYIVQQLFPGAIISTNRDILAETDSVCINYSSAYIPGVLNIFPSKLLFENGICEQNIACTAWEDGLKIFFQTAGDIPFDVFSAAFYLLSRYEEWLPYTPDEYGRYPHQTALAYRSDFLRIPLIDCWLRQVNAMLKSLYPSYQPRQREFRFIPTYDVDETFAYLHKPLWKNIGGFFRDLLQGKLTEVLERGNVYAGQQKDPYDTFQWLNALHAQFGLQPVYFLLTLLEQGAYDKNLPVKKPVIQNLYKQLADQYQTGLHPSWISGDKKNLLQQELQTAEQITGNKITRSRNHYLRFTIPETYRRLLSAGIIEDHSMAYGAVNGFRASTSYPFYWYDLEKEMQTPLLIRPFCFMEAAACFSEGLSAEQAGLELQYFYDTVQQVQGDCVILFHNHFLTEQPQWIAWREMYADFLRRNSG
jgi:hypothetical protein